MVRTQFFSHEHVNEPSACLKTKLILKACFPDTIFLEFKWKLF